LTPVSQEETQDISDNQAAETCLGFIDDGQDWLGTKEDELADYSQDDVKFLKTVVRQVRQRPDAMLEFPLPFKGQEPVFTCNENYARNRTKNMAQKLKKDPVRLASTLDKFSKNFDTKDPVFVRVPGKHKGKRNHQGRAYWIPLFTVWQKGKSRIVFDSAASVTKEQSLNKVLLPGPDRNNSLTGVLLRFRQHPYAMSADVANMFHHIAIPDRQSTYLRFFWFEDNDPDKDMVEYWSKVHLMGNTSSPAIANLAVRYAARKIPPVNGGQWLQEDNLLDPYQRQRTRTPDETERVLSQQIYVDDLLASRPTQEETEQLLEEAITRFQRYQLEFCKIASNVPRIQDKYPNSMKGAQMKNLSPIEAQTSDPEKGRSLGLQWNMKTDRFSVKTEHKNRVRTKRGFLGQIMEPYDPFGIAQPAMLACKLLQREIWPLPGDDPHGCRPLGWDDPLPSVFDRPWNKMSQICQDIQNLSISRSFYPKDHGVPEHQQLFAFADASDLALCYVVYLRTRTTDGSVFVAFICGYTKVLPKGTSIKGHISIPRAELCAADLLTKRMLELEKEIDISNLHPTQFFTDSRDVLGWITNTTDKFPRYVSARRNRICLLSKPEQW